MFSKHKVTAIIPALNEADSIGLVVSELWEQIDLNQTPLIDQVIVCDNGSEDATAKRAKQAGAKGDAATDRPVLLHWIIIGKPNPMMMRSWYLLTQTIQSK